MTSQNRLGAVSVALTVTGCLFLIGAMWSHRNWPGFIGLAFWIPGTILYVRYFVRVRSARAARRIDGS